ncbi:MAG: TonB-dependent receptor [Pseudomonadota bacterium]
MHRGVRGAAQNALAWALLSIGLWVPTALAQLEEVVVTAAKRTQSTQDLGVSVAAIGGDEILKQSLVDSGELLQAVTNLDFRRSAGSTNANIFVRGVGTTGVGFNVQSGVGVYFDEVVLNSPVVNVAQLYDLERVEVIRGPQNTLYGRNTTGGAINFISNKPEVGGETNGYLNASYGRFNEINLEGAVGGPIGDTAAYRIAAQSQQRDGIRTNRFDGRDNVERDKTAVRAQLAFEPSETVAVNLKAHVERIRSDNFRLKNAGGQDAQDPSQPCATPYVLGSCADSNGFVDSANFDSFNQDMIRPMNDVDAMGASAHVTMDFEAFALTSITAYEENEQMLSEDTDASPAHDFHFFIESEADQVSQEFRLTSAADGDFRWILGAYGFWETKSGTTGPTFATPMGIMLVRSDAEFDNTSYSAYGEVQFDATDKLTLIAGGRIGYDQVEGSSVALFAFESQLPGLDIATPSSTGRPLPDFDALLAAGEANGAGVIRVGGPTDPDADINDTSWTEWGGKLGAEYRATDDVLVYGSWSRGYKAGVFPNAPMAIMLGQGDTPNEPEFVVTYEAGIKSEFADGKARLNAAVFYSDYTDQQVAQFIFGEFTVISVDSEITGAEFDLNWQPTDGLRIDAGVAFLDTEITKSPDESQVGNELIYAPDISGRLSATQEWILSQGSILGIAGEVRYTGQRFFNLANQVQEDSYTVLNAQAFYEFGSDGQYRVSLWGKNLADEEYIDNRSIDSAYHALFISDPRTYGVTLNMQF